MKLDLLRPVFFSESFVARLAINKKRNGPLWGDKNIKEETILRKAIF